jgi:hypothetical protein
MLTLEKLKQELEPYRIKADAVKYIDYLLEKVKQKAASI